MSFLGPVATTASYGLVMIGNNISVTDGVISTTAGGGGSLVGTWTPTITISTAGTITLTTATANYTKIGQQVTCYFDITVATKTGGTNSNLLSLNGLPFASVAGTGIQGSLVVSIFQNLNTNKSYITGTVAGSATSVLLYQIHNATDNERLAYADVQAGATPTRFVGTITYISVL